MGKAMVVNGQAANDGMWGAGFEPARMVVFQQTKMKNIML